MPHHLTSHTFNTEEERDQEESELKQKGFRKIPPLTTPGDRQYRLFEGSSDPHSFEGDPMFGIEWCEDK